MKNFIKNNFIIITLVITLLGLFKSCGDSRELSKMRKEVESIKDSTYTKTELDVELKNKVASGELTEISIALDNDAKTDALKIYEKYSKYIPTIKLIDFQEKDAGELKFKDILKYQKNSVTLSFESLIKQKLSFIK